MFRPTTGALLGVLAVISATALVPAWPGTAAGAQGLQAPVRINAGGPQHAVGDVVFSGCQTDACHGYVTGGFAYAEVPAPEVTGAVAPTDAVIHQTEWTGGQTRGVPAGQPAFRFAIPVAAGTYRLRLHFAELNKFAAGARVFDVNVEGGNVELAGFDIFAQAGGAHLAIVREFDVQVLDGSMDIEFVTQVENAKVGAIEVLPLELAPTPAPTPAPVPPAEPTPETWTPLFNGRDLAGWQPYLEGIGHADPQGVFQVTDAGEIHVLNLPVTTGGYPFGYLATDREYTNYRLRFQYRWGERRFAPREQRRRDTGVLYHLVGDDRVWPTSIETQVQEGDTGDYWVLGGAQLTTTVDGQSDPPQYRVGGAPFDLERMGKIVKSGTHDSRTEWNTVEVIVTGDEGVTVVNGHVNNRATDFRTAQGPLTAGRIAFQAEGAEVYYRNIEIAPLTAPAAPPESATVLFDGTSLDGWMQRTGEDPRWTIVDGELIVGQRRGDLRTRQSFGDARVHVEFRVPPIASDVEQRRGNSGVALQQRYEVQVLDSFDHAISGANDAGAIYGIADPATNAALPASAWQSYDIVFRAARWQAGAKIADARMTVYWNGVLVHHDVALPFSTRTFDAESPALGPLTLQDHGNRVRYRNIWVAPLD